MRASMTHVFGRDLGLGSEKWHKNEQTGHMAGNPSVSIQLASYMVSLRNRKVIVFFFQSIFLPLKTLIARGRFVLVMLLLVLEQSPQYVYHFISFS